MPGYTVKICTPVNGDPTPAYRESLESLFASAHGKMSHVLMYEAFQSCYLYSSRNALISGGTWAVDEAVRNARQFDYYWYIDSDISGFSYDLLDRMISMGRDIVCTAYRDRNDPEKYVAGHFTDHRATRSQFLKVSEAADNMNIDFAGLGCCLIRSTVFDKMDFPWFHPKVVEYYMDGRCIREVPGEDLAFFRRTYFLPGINKPLLLIDENIKHGR